MVDKVKYPWDDLLHQDSAARRWLEAIHWARRTLEHLDVYQRLSRELLGYCWWCGEEHDGDCEVLWQYGEGLQRLVVWELGKHSGGDGNGESVN